MFGEVGVKKGFLTIRKKKKAFFPLFIAAPSG